MKNYSRIRKWRPTLGQKIDLFACYKREYADIIKDVTKNIEGKGKNTSKCIKRR